MFRDRVENPWLTVPDEPSLQASLTQKLENSLAQLVEHVSDEHSCLSHGVTLFGSSGLGKTHLLMRLAQQWMPQHPFYYVRVPSQVDYIAASFLSQCRQSVEQQKLPAHPGFPEATEQLESLLSSLKHGFASQEKPTLSVLALDGWSTLRQRSELTRRWEDTLRGIFAEIPNLLILSVMNVSLWSQWLSKLLAHDVVQRIATEAYDMEAMHPTQSRTLAARIMQYDFPTIPAIPDTLTTPRQLLRHLQRHKAHTPSKKNSLLPIANTEEWSLVPQPSRTSTAQWDSYEWDDPTTAKPQEPQPTTPLGTLSEREPTADVFRDVYSSPKSTIEVTDFWKLPGLSSMAVIQLAEALPDQGNWEGCQLRRDKDVWNEDPVAAELIAQQDDPTLWCVYSPGSLQTGSWTLHPTIWQTPPSSPMNHILQAQQKESLSSQPTLWEWESPASHPAMGSFLVYLSKNLVDSTKRTLLVLPSSQQADNFAINLGKHLQKHQSKSLSLVARAGLTTEPQTYSQDGLDSFLKGSDTEALQQLEILPAKLRRTRDGHRTQRLAEQLRKWESRHQNPLDTTLHDEQRTLVITTLRHIMNVDTLLSHRPQLGERPRFHNVILPLLSEWSEHQWKRCQRWAKEKVIWLAEEME